ncbi:hypothetical protein [Streptomyces sp. NPDC057363]|uniref:hypothetical protein n=1 Tax=Streptomyces sp. NPDC057363 TaxID=3346107 RepID=UPI003640C096
MSDENTRITAYKEPAVAINGNSLGQTATVVIDDKHSARKSVTIEMDREHMEALVKEFQECFTFWDTPVKPWGSE